MITGRHIINADGASRRNPGPAAIGATIKDERGRRLASISKRIGRATNNQAEYQALIAALEKAIAMGARQVDIRLDSELVVKQMKGRYRVKNAVLRSLYLRVGELLSQLEGFTISSVPREQNTEADQLANRALTRDKSG
jgi:ribonuclease HI